MINIRSIIAVIFCMTLIFSTASCTDGTDNNTTAPDTTAITTAADPTGTTQEGGLSIADDTDGGNYGELHLVD